MLKSLKVENLATIENAGADFGPGLTVITGETGAGKSVFMGALSLALGGRADADAVRDGCKEARICAEFDSAGAGGFLEEAGLPPCEDGTLLVRRTISASGGSRVWINDTPATVQALRSLGERLVDVHGPNDRKSLADETFQRESLDRFGDIGLSGYSASWGELVSLRRRREEIASVTGVDGSEAERLKYSIDEIDAAELTGDDEESLAARHAAAAHAADIASSAGAAMEALSGSGGNPSAVDMLVAAAANFREMARYYEPAAEWVSETERLVTAAQELSRTVMDAAGGMDSDPETLQALDDRISLVRRLKRKFSCATVKDILELRERLSERLADIECREERLRETDAAIAAAESAVRKAGAEISAARRRAGAKFASAVTRELRGLGFLQAGFSVAVDPREPDSSGCDRITFRFEPNPGEPERPLAQIASTGEIARVMLAVETVLAGKDSTPVLVFDEIDANIGGETGRAVGERMKEVSRHHQVIAITHLPQSAAFGDSHLIVEKSVSGGRTRTSIRTADRDGREKEIARMLGGDSGSRTAIGHARELLSGK